MKLKRTLAMVLALILFLGNVPLTAFSAETDDSVDTTPITYSFDLRTTYPNDFTTGDFSVRDQKDKIDVLYNNGDINWTYHSCGVLGTDTRTSIYKNQFAKGQGIQAYTAYHDWYYAIAFRAPGTGTYDITLGTYLVQSGGAMKHSVWTESYVVKADELSANIKDSLTDDTRIKRFAPTVTNTDAYIGNVEFEAGEDYVLILRETIDTARDANADQLSTAHLFLSGMSFVETVPPEPVKGGYNFDLMTIYPDDFTSSTFAVDEQKAKMDKLYDGGYLDWTFHSRGILGENNNANIYRNQWNKGNGLQAYVNYHNWYYAIKFRSPGEGNYDITMGTFLVMSGGAMKHSVWTESYVVKASELTEVEAALTDDNQIKRFAPTVDKTDAYLGNVAFEENEDYILILRQTRDTSNDAHADGLSTAHLFLKGLSFVEAEPPEPVKGGYSFDLMTTYPDDFKNGTFSVSEQKKKIDKLFNGGYLNWTFHSYGVSGDDTRTNIYRNEWLKGSGFQVYTNYHDWYYAIVFRSPGTGTFDFNIDTYLTPASDADGNPVNKHSVWTESYVIKASELNQLANIKDAFVEEYRVKRFTPTTENTTAYIGNVAFEADETYVLILRETMTTSTDSHASDNLSTQHLYLKGMSFVEAEPPVPEKGGYNFDLMTTYPDDFMGGTKSVTDQKAKIDKLFNGGYLDWRFHSYGVLGEDSRTSIYRNEWYKGYGFQVYTAYHDWYYAIEFRAPGTGNYNITLNTYLTPSKDANGNSVMKHSTWTETYIVESSKLANVKDALTKENRVKRFTPTSENPDAYIGNVALEAGKTYVIILRETMDVCNDGFKDGLSTNHLFLKGLSFDQAAPPAPANGGYSFDLMTIYPDDFTNDTETAVIDQKDMIDTLYKGGYLNWTFYKHGAEGDGKGNVYRNNFVKGSGMQIYGQNYDWWYAIRIKSPGKGPHKVTLDSFLTQSKGADGKPIMKHSVWVNAYIVEASSVDSGKVPFQNIMIKRNLVGVFNPTAEDPSVDVGYFDFEEGKEYVLFLRQTKKTYNAGKEVGETTLNLYLKGLKFEYTANPPKKYEDTSKVIFDFDLADNENGIYPGGVLLNDKISDVSRLYSLDEINWRIEKVAASNAKFYIGVTTYGAADDYVAFRIKNPGKGLYTLSLNYGISGRGGTGAVYILPVSAADNIEDAMDIHNRVGRVKYYNQSADPNPTDGYNTLLGTWEFGSDREYIVVFEAFAPCPYGVATSYMYFSQLICERGDTTANYEAEKTINSVLVKDGPVNTLDCCIYLASGQVNGHDYLYLPIEGKKMNVYDIDAGEFVAQVDTPFTTSRGIAVDDEGIVWVVGDNPYIFRYDPVLNIGESVYYYKSYTEEGGSRGDNKIYGVQSSHDMCYGSDGALYFGSSFGANFGRYDTKTGEFTNLGSFGGDGATYSCTPAYYAEEDVLMGTISGDINTDGHKTTMLVKMNAKTGEVIDSLDMSDKVGQKEVMLRGAGICNGVMLIGGDSAGSKQAIAVDLKTMEYVDLGIQAHISSGVTEALNGKVYFQTQGLGLYEYDGETRTATKMNVSEAFNLPMSCNEDSFITVEGDEQFPGQSILTFRYGTAQPVVLNPKTGKFKVLENIVSEDQGTGNQLLSFATSPDNPDYIYMGVFNNLNCSVMDTKTGEIVAKYETNGQTDAMVFYKGKLYVGNYSSASLVQINLDDKNRNVSLMTLKTEYDQARIHSMTAGGNKVFIGTIPYTYEYGGCLAWIDVETLEYHVERHVVQNQNVVGLAYHDGLIYGGTATGGGLSADPFEGDSAKVFIYDVDNKQKLIEIDPRDYISGLPETVKGTTGLVCDPEVDKNGLIWGIVGGTVYTLKYDKATGKVEMKEQLSFDKAEIGEGWVDTPMQIIDGYLYVYMGTKGGMRKINIRNVQDNERLPIPRQYKYYVGNDGNLYYGIDAQLYMYPLNITDADWAAAEVVDAKLKDIGEITLESEETLKAIEAEYNALTWAQKALIQNLYKLEDANIELLECKIDTIGEVTIEKADLIRDLKKQYDALSPKSKNYIKNFRTVLVPALTELQRLFDIEEAAKIQAMIDTIPGMGEITLEKEPAIREIETAYNGLSIEQKELIDATHLENALEIIRALRKERIDHLIELIAQIGDDVTLDDEPLIDEATEIYNWMTMTERELIDYETLVVAQNKLKKLQKAAATEVDTLIVAIGDTVGYSSGKAIKAARAAYDALTPGSKQYVKHIGILEEAEELYNSLFPIWAYILIAVVVVGAGAAGAVIFIKRKKVAIKPEEAHE